MARHVDVKFRGEEKTVIVDQYDIDYDTNALDVSWHFDDLTPTETDALRITDAEEDAIVEAIGQYIHDED